MNVTPPVPKQRRDWASYPQMTLPQPAPNQPKANKSVIPPLPQPK
jgi:hypothetical protein